MARCARHQVQRRPFRSPFRAGEPASSTGHGLRPAMVCHTGYGLPAGEPASSTGHGLRPAMVCRTGYGLPAGEPASSTGRGLHAASPLYLPLYSPPAKSKGDRRRPGRRRRNTTTTVSLVSTQSYPHTYGENSFICSLPSRAAMRQHHRS